MFVRIAMQKDIFPLLHKRADLLLDTPSSLIGYAKVPFDFLRRNAIFRLTHKKDGKNQSVRFVEDLRKMVPARG